MSVNYGSKRLVVGAHYGFRDWLGQRVTAVLMALFTVALLLQVLLGGPMGYDKWAGIFSAQWMKVFTFVVIVSLLYHAWVGMRDVIIDYVHIAPLRLVLLGITLLMLSASLMWSLRVLWNLPIA